MSPPLNAPYCVAYAEVKESVAPAIDADIRRWLTSNTINSTKLSDCPVPLDVNRTAFGYGLRGVIVGVSVEEMDAPVDSVEDGDGVDVCEDV